MNCILTPHHTPAHLEAYVNQPFLKDVRFDPGRRMYTSQGEHYGGLNSKLKAIHYPHWERKRKRRGERGKNPRKGSSRAQGKAIDRQLGKYVECGRKPTNPLARAIIRYLEESSQMRIVGAQVPVYIKVLNRVTEADLVCEDMFGRLWMFEVKSGFNNTKAQGDFRGLPGVPCRQNTIWELQRHYTHKGMVEGGLKLAGSHVLNVYEEDGQVTVRKRKVPSWVMEKFSPSSSEKSGASRRSSQKKKK